MASRLDVRLDPERRQRLEEMARALGVPISDVIRGLIDDAYESILRERRRKAVDHLVSLEVEDPPDPQALCQELEAAHEPGGLH
jgi:predicted DNA-binding protein